MRHGSLRLSTRLAILAHCLLCAVLFAPLTELFAEELNQEPELTQTVAVIRDGPSWYFDLLIEKFTTDLAEMAGRNYPLKIQKPLNGNWNVKRIAELLEQSLEDPDVDLIFASGVVSTDLASRLPAEKRQKPIIGGSVQFVQENRFLVSSEGTSSVSNFNFIASPRRVERDIGMLKELTGAKTIHVLLNKNVFTSKEQVRGPKVALEKQFGITFKIIITGSSAKEALAKIPSDTEALYVAIQIQMDDEERRKLYAGIIEKKIPSLAMYGRQDTELGALAALAPATVEPAARRAALNAHQILSGLSANDLPVYLPVEDHLVLNAQTARKIGYSPEYQLVLSAEMIHRKHFTDGETLSLESAMQRAAEQNAEMLITEAQVAITAERENISKSALLPQLSSFSNYSRNDFREEVSIPVGDLQIPNTPDWNEEISYGVRLSQILFDDEVISGYRASKRNVESSELDTEAAELNAKEQAGIAFLDLLTQKALYQVERDNLQLTENNLELAKIRNAIGAIDSQEIFRWEADVASSRAAVIRRDSLMHSALVTLNRTLSFEREKEWKPTDIQLGNEEFYFLDKELGDGPKKLQQFRELWRFVGKFAVLNAPELRSFDRLLEAEGILLRERKRRFYIPKLSLESTLSGSNSDSSPGEASDQGTWALSANASLPLFEGGRRIYEVREKEAEILRLRRQRKNALQFIEQNALNAFNGFWGTHPNISLSRRALESAEKNYASVRTKYGQGTADILDLLDAQNALLERRRNAAVAVYDYLKELVRLQRAISWFSYEKTSDERKSFVKQMRETFSRIKQSKMEETTSNAKN